MLGVQLQPKQSLLLHDEYLLCDQTPLTRIREETMVIIIAQNEKEILSECCRIGDFANRDKVSVTNNRIVAGRAEKKFVIVCAD